MSNIISSGSNIMKFNSGEVIEVGVSLPLTTPTMWLSSNNVEKDGDNRVHQWNDKSFNGYSPTQNMHAIKPLWVDDVVNGHPVLRFSGDQYMVLNFGRLFPQPNTFFVVWSSAVSHAGCVIDGITGFRNCLRTRQSPDAVMLGHAFANNVYYQKQMPFSPIVSTAVFNTVYSELYENSLLMISGNQANEQLKELKIGIAYNNTVPLVGDIAEIIFYDSLLSAPQRQLVENSLMNKYAL